MFRKHFTRFFCLLAVLMLLTACAGAEGLLSDWLSTAESLLFQTDNCTLRLKANFELDGERFKTAEYLLRLDGFTSFRQLNLLTPLRDGGERKSGYTVYAGESGTDGMLDAVILETLHPDKISYRGVEAPLTPSAMTLTSELSTLLSIGHSALDVLEGIVSGCITQTLYEDGGEGIRVTIKEEQLPPLCHDMLTMLAKYAARRFFGIDFDRIREEDWCYPEYFLSVTDRIVNCMREVWLSGCDIALDRKQDGSVQGSGTVLLGIVYRDYSEHSLKISFSASAEDIGATTAEAFQPENSGAAFEHKRVEPAPSSKKISLNEALSRAMEITREGILGVASVSESQRSVSRRDALYSIELFSGDPVPGTTLQLQLRDDGSLRSIENTSADWRHASVIESDESEVNYRSELARRFEAFEEAVNPGSTAFYLSQHPDHGASDGIYYGLFNMELSDGKNRYLVFYTDRDETETRKSMFVMQVAPYERLVFYDGDTDPEEGGNG